MALLKEKSMKLSEYFEVVNPTYIYYKLTPLKTLRNYDTDGIINAIANVYKRLSTRLVKEQKKWFFYAPIKLSYYLYMEKEEIQFFFVVPEKYKTVLVDKIKDAWLGVTIERVDYVPSFSKESIKYFMDYEKNDALSLSVDKRSNILLSSILSITQIMEEKDKIGIVYNFIPQNQRFWRTDCEHTIRAYREGMPIDKNRISKGSILKYFLKIVMTVCDVLVENFNGLLGEEIIARQAPLLSTYDLSSETMRKKDQKVVGTQIVVLSESKDKNRAINNAVSICEDFNTVNGDNCFKYKQIRNSKEDFQIERYKFKGAGVMMTTAKESQNFVSLPGKELIDEYKIKCVDVLETKTPKELLKGVINIGKSHYRGSENNVFLCNDKELRNLSLCITGSNRSGKTTLISNITADLLNNNECIFIPDFCGSCELTNHLQSLFPDKTLIIDCSDLEHLQGMGYNEVDMTEKNTFKRYVNAKMQAVQLMTLVNSINDVDRNLKAKMDRYLESASLVSFMNGGSIKDVFDILYSYKARRTFINKVTPEQMDNLSEYIDSLNELDDIDKEGNIVGTKFINIAGIVDRLNVLKKNPYIELMFKKDCDNNINLLNEIQKSQIICVKIPEKMFSTSSEKDIFCTYWFSKLWLSLQLRKENIERDKHIKLNIIYDELYQVPKCQALIASKLSQMPKFTAKLIVSCHYLNQIDTLKRELKASNASYMILQGSNVNNFNELKSEFENLNYKVEDLLNLKRFHSLNLLSYENGYWAGITALPKPRKKFTT